MSFWSRYCVWPSTSCVLHLFFVFFFNDTATTEIYTLSLHDALPISRCAWPWTTVSVNSVGCSERSEEHTSELQSHSDLVCRLLLEKKKNLICLLIKKKINYIKRILYIALF